MENTDVVLLSSNGQDTAYNCIDTCTLYQAGYRSNVVKYKYRDLVADSRFVKARSSDNKAGLWEPPEYRRQTQDPGSFHFLLPLERRVAPTTYNNDLVRYNAQYAQRHGPK